MRSGLVVAMLLLVSMATVARADVVIEGIDGREAANVRAQLSLLELQCDTPAWLVRWQYRNVEDDVAKALEALGYYRSHVEKSLEFPEGRCWQARIVVAKGEQVVVRSVTIAVDGPLATEREGAAVIARGNAMLDKPLDHGLYEQAKRAIFNAARSLGYFDARAVQTEVRVDPAAGRADVTIRVDGGERYRFGEVTISQHVVKRDLVDAYVPFKPGTSYRADLVSKLQRNLAGSGYFGHVSVVAEPAEDGSHTVPVRIEASPPLRHWTYGVGLGYATDTGVRLRADANSPRLNQRGHRADVRAVVSKVHSDIEATYGIPHGSPLDDWFAFTTGFAHEETDTETSDITKFGARHTYERWHWIETDFVELDYEDFTIADQSSQSRLVLFGTTFTRVWRDEPMRPMRGLRLTATVRGATQELGSDTDFAQAQLGAKLVHRLFDNVRVLVRGDAGWTWKSEFNELPPSVRYFAGGDASVRGYGYEDLGPEKDGEVVGGSGLLTGSVEFDWAFAKRWSVAAFVDSGSAYDREPTFSTGVGAGIRWYSPLGPVRIDVAHPLDDPTRELRLHVSLGPDL